MSELDDLQKQTKASAIRFFGWAIMVLLIILGAWASQAELDEVATATGEFVPQGQVKTIQHLEGGIIEEMFVNQGDRVVAGSPLVRLDLNASQGREAELQVTLDGLMLRR
ncbi:MAG: HlyD family type I secretion periplasmic adaptor subunit, partial [Rhodospirillaceae bacterium]|nr:HlyD family type I secretion periplasmic adaptor subunit [Rhodospirillaceae bacterium]